MMLRSIVSEKSLKIQILVCIKDAPPQYQRTEQHQDSRKHARDHFHSKDNQKLAQRQMNLEGKFKFEPHFR